MKKRGKGFVVVAGQMPPPVGGQSINVERFHRLLKRIGRWEVRHWRFNFTKDSSNFSTVGLDKILESFRVIFRLWKIRREGPIDAVIYSVGGPHLAPILRDAILLPWAYLMARRVFLHFQAAGLKEYLAACPAPVAAVAKMIYPRATRAIVLSEFGRRDPESAGLADCFVMPNGLEDHAGEWGAESRVKEEASPVKILSAGHLCREKGTPELIRAFGAIQQQFPETVLHLVGEPARDLTLADLEELCAETGVPEKIIHRGLLGGEDLQGAYREADLFVFSTVAPYESFGMVLIEAMNWSLPIVATDWRANREVCGEGNGVVFALDVSENLTQSLETALLQALENRALWPKWGKLNRERFEKCYTIAELEKRLRELLA